MQLRKIHIDERAYRTHAPDEDGCGPAAAPDATPYSAICGIGEGGAELAPAARTPVELATGAATAALVDAGVDAGRLDWVLAATGAESPPVAADVAGRIGAPGAAAVDIRAGGTASGHGLALADSLVRSGPGPGGHVLLIEVYAAEAGLALLVGPGDAGPPGAQVIHLPRRSARPPQPLQPSRPTPDELVDAVAEALRTLLPGGGRADRDTSFFADRYGGPVLVAETLAEVEPGLGVRLPHRQLMAVRTVGDLVDRLDELLGPAGGVAA
ncbi:acyl carrier protein [Plantactinospora sp. KBS50]|uniref:acyl carrier protein n=1 Tax=Plantactinospora sp. KBS50 TaxID=2024580 RepID=UPI000BAAC7C9|nr:hypothetical protein [Plantactinospora sp. KBS50]ASW53294.1 hypothetical protein CIK06_02500 [Plantactinospora sp. KBS50]